MAVRSFPCMQMIVLNLKKDPFRYCSCDRGFKEVDLNPSIQEGQMTKNSYNYNISDVANGWPKDINEAVAALISYFLFYFWTNR